MKKLVVFLSIIFIAFATPALAQEAGSASDASAGASANITTIDNSSHKSKNDQARYFPNPGITPLPQTNGFFTSPTPDSSFRSVKELIRFNNKFSRGALEQLAKGGNVDLHYQIVNDAESLPRGFEEGEVEKLEIVVKAPRGFKNAAMVDGEADNGDTNSFQVIGKLGLEALDDGCTVLLITAEGAHRGVHASGWGIGLYTVGGDVSDSGESIIGGGGTGYANNQTGTEDKPWIQGYSGIK